MESRVCYVCKKRKNKKYFNKNKRDRHGFGHICKKCQNEVGRNHYQKNKKKVLENCRIYRNNNKEKIRKYHAEHYKKNKDKIIKTTMAYSKKRRMSDPLFYLIDKVRSRITGALNYNKVRKSYKTLKYIGCTWLELKEHLESQFKPGMSWENRSRWHVDHIIPLALFDLTDLEQQKTAFHVTNLQPLWAKDNLKKGGR